MPSVTLQPTKPKLSNLQTFLKEIEAKNKKVKKGWEKNSKNLLRFLIYLYFN